MVVNNSIITVFFITIMSSFNTNGDSRKSFMEMSFYNSITNINLTRTIDGEYYYKDGDTLSVSCSYTKYKYLLPSYTAIRLYQCKNGTWNVENLTECAATAYRGISQIIADSKLDKNNDNDAIICEYKNSNYDSVLERLSTMIVLVPDEPPTIVVNDLHFYKSLLTPNIYEGTRGENVRINCQNNENRGTLHWDFCKNITQGNSCPTQVKNEKKIYYADFTLDQELNGTEFKCVFTNVKQRNTVTSVLFNIRPGKTVEFIANRCFWVIVGVGVLIIIILMIIIIYVYKSKTLSQEGDHEDVTYENLSSAVLPFPNSAILEEIYLIPSDRRDVTKATDNNDVTHALPYIETNSENLYSKPLPKSIHNQPQYPEISRINIKPNELTYAEIYTLSNNDDKQIGNKIEYATIKGINPNYANVFVDETYVNGKDEKEEDFEDPNYCKVEKLIKDSS